METVGVRELRQNASKVLDRVRAGETVGVTDRGRAVARITPEPNSEWDALIESGLVRPPVSTKPLHTIKTLPAKSGTSMSELLSQLRDDER